MSYIYKTGRAELHDQIKRHASFIKGQVLDVGGGNYPRYKDLFKFDKYTVMDMNGGRGVDVVGKIEEIPFPDNTFDSIVCTQVLGDVFELEKAFKELYRVLKPDGTALITENLFDALHGEPHDYWRLTEHSFRLLSEHARFKIEVLERRGGYHSVMAQLKARYWIELLDANSKWFARPLSFLLKIRGTWARRLDHADRSRANKIFTHGYLLVVRKNASA